MKIKKVTRAQLCSRLTCRMTFPITVQIEDVNNYPEYNKSGRPAVLNKEVICPFCNAPYKVTYSAWKDRVNLHFVEEFVD